MILLCAYVLFNLIGPRAEQSTALTIMHLAALAVLFGTSTSWLSRKPAEGGLADQSSGLLPTVRRLACAIDAADPFTRGRAYRVSRYAVRIAETLGLRPCEVEEIEYAALLHNIGRVAIHRDVLLKSGRLTDDERREVETHPQVAYEVLRDIAPLKQAAELVLAHTERPDGSGYPRGLEGRAIPVGSQIIKVASAFDAMTSDRPYRSGLSPEAAFGELQNGAGTEFDARAVKCLVRLYETRALFDDFDADELRLYGDDPEHVHPLTPVRADSDEATPSRPDDCAA